MPRLRSFSPFGLALPFALLLLLGGLAQRGRPAAAAGLLLHTTLESASAIAAPVAGVGGTTTLLSSDFVPAQVGNGAQFVRQGHDCQSADSQLVTFPVLSGGVQNVELDRGEVELWYRPNATIANGGPSRALLVIGVDGYNPPTLRLQAGDTLELSITQTDWTGVATASEWGAPLWNADAWVHIRAVWDNADPADSLRLYVDGDRVDTGGAPGGWNLGPEDENLTIIVGAGTLCGDFIADGILDELIIRDATQTSATATPTRTPTATGTPTRTATPTATSTSTSVPSGDGCSPDADGDGVVTMLDVQRRAIQPACVSFLPQIARSWRQPWPGASATPTPTAAASATPSPTPTVSTTPAPLQVPLLIQEALPDDPAQAGFQLLPGLDRSQEPVTVGLPLPEDAGISDVTQLGLSGASAGQFRVLARWPNGNVKWVLVDTLADVAAGTQETGISLTGGAGGFGGPNLAADQGTTIAVNTGPAQFTIRKQGFNLFDAVTVNGVMLVTPGTSPGVELIGTGGTVFRAANDANVQVSIEENGPVRAVIVAKGTHYSTGGQRNLDFTVRMHFYKGKSRVRVFYTLRNASKAQVENAGFRSLDLVVASTMSQPQFALSNHTGQTTGSLSPGSTVRLFQGENAFPNVRDYDFECCWPTTIAGYTISRDGQVLASGTRDQFIDLFYGQARAADGRAVTIGTRFAAGWWPQGLSIDGDGTLRVGLFPAGNDRPYYARFFGHVTRELLFDFASAAPNPRDTFFRFQYPLVARAADVDWYNRSGALWEKIVSFTDEAAYYQSHGWPVENDQYATLNRRPEFRIWRHQYWGAGGGLNQYDFTRVDLHNFLRQEALYAGGYFLNAEQRLAYNADLATYHSDDFHAARAASEVPELYDPVSDGVKGFEQLPNGDRVPQAKAIFEGEHRHAYGMGFWYYLSGDERFRETYTDWGEYMQTQENWNGWERGLAWNLYNLVDLYRFTGDTAYRDLAWQSLRQEVLDKTAVYLQSAGTDWQRGFFVPESDATDPERSMAAFIKGAMFPRSYAYFHDFAAASNLEADRARDVLEGMVRFVAHELWFEYAQNPGDFGFPYRVSADSAPPADVRTMEEWYGGLKEAYLTFVYGYLLTGDQEFLRRGELLQKATAYDTPGGYWFQDLPDRQTLQHLLQHTGEYPLWRDLPVAVQNNGAGSYTLSWTVPAGARQYWIKYSEQPIVPWLNFDRYTRQYQYDPNQYVPFFAAANVADEPTPAQPGTTQTYTISGLDPATTYNFAVRAYVDPPTSAALAAQVTKGAEELDESVAMSRPRVTGGHPLTTARRARVAGAARSVPRSVPGRGAAV